MPRLGYPAKAALLASHIGIHRQLENIMANLDNIDGALNDLSEQITQLAEQVAGLTAGDVTQEQLDDIAARIGDAASRVDAIVGTDDETEEPPPAP